MRFSIHAGLLARSDIVLLLLILGSSANPIHCVTWHLVVMKQLRHVRGGQVLTRHPDEPRLVLVLCYRLCKCKIIVVFLTQRSGLQTAFSPRVSVVRAALLLNKLIHIVSCLSLVEACAFMAYGIG